MPYAKVRKAAFGGKGRHDYFCYVAGRIEAQLEAYAGSANVSFTELAGWVGNFLYRKASGIPLGPENSMPPLSEDTAVSRSTLEQVAVGSHPRASVPKKAKVADRRSQWTAAARKRQGLRMRKLWASGKLEGKTGRKPL